MTPMQFVLLITDLFVFTLVISGLFYLWHVSRHPHLQSNWSLAFKRPVAVVSSLVLGFFLLIALVDSIHFKLPLSAQGNTASIQVGEPQSLLDFVLQPLVSSRERSYSAPLSAHGFRKETFLRDGVTVRDYPRLQFGGVHLKNPEQELGSDVLARSTHSLAWGLGLSLFALMLALGVASHRSQQSWGDCFKQFRTGQSRWPWRSMALTLSLMLLAGLWLIQLSQVYHVFGTDRTGNSVLLFALKSIRTALVIGSLTTLVILPIALLLGVVAGYFRGWIDEVIQYFYTLLASIPDVLLIAATVLMLQVYIDKNTGIFQSALERSDARLFFLCFILGLTSFTGLCRLVRGETLKLRELEYIQAAKAFGVSTPRLMFAHIVPNLMHLVMINCVMQFSGFILAEAILSYVGVGVDPNTASFGVMINTARSELAATPVVWWTLATAFLFMFLLVLSANLLADAIRDAFDPRMRLRSASLRRHPAQLKPQMAQQSVPQS